MLVSQGISFEAGRQKEVLVIHRYQVEPSWGSHVELLEGLKALGEIIPQVYPGEGEITSQNEVLAEAHREGIDCHRTPRWESLDLYKTLAFPAEDLGVTDEAGEAKVERSPHPEVLDHLNISHLCYLGMEDKLLLASVPLVNHWCLRRT